MKKIKDKTKKGGKMAERETAEEFIDRLKALPDPDTNDPKVMEAFVERLDSRARPEIEEEIKRWKKSAGRAFTMVVR